MPPTVRPFPIAGDGPRRFFVLQGGNVHVVQPHARLRVQPHENARSVPCLFFFRHVRHVHRRLHRQLRDRPVRRPGHGDRISHHHGGKPDRLGKGLSRRLFPFQHQRQILRGNGGSAGRRSRHHLPCGARTGDRHPHPRKAGAADHPARAHQAQLARLLRRRGHGGRQRGHRRRGREQGPDARLRKRQGRPRPEAPGNAGRLQQV